jgi:signal transduction histidine kinase
VNLRRVLALLLVLCAAPVHAIDRALALAQLHHTAWLTRDGAPGQVNALAQTSDGTLWLGSDTGLVRFDGLEFRRFQPPPGEAGPTASVSALLARPGDGLWIGYRFGGVGWWKDGRLRHFGRAEGLPSGTVLALERDADARLWAGTTTGLARFDGRQWAVPPEAASYPHGATYALHADRAGTLWAVAEDGTWFLRRGAAAFERSSRSISFAWLAQRANGQVWEANGTQGLWPLPEADGPPRQQAAVPGPGRLGPLLFDRDDVLWVGVEGGLARLRDADRLPPLTPAGDPRADPEDRFDRRQGLSGAEVLAMLEDREGSVWVSTSGGLDRFRANKLARVELPPETLFPALAPAPGGGVLVGSPEATALRLGAGPPHRFPDVGPRITSVARDDRGTVWMAGALGVWAIARDETRRVPLPAAVAGTPVQAMVDMGAGRMRLAIVRHGQWEQDPASPSGWRLMPEPPGGPDANPLAMARDPRGRLWLGYAFDRLVRMTGTRVDRSWQAADGLGVGSVLCLAPQGDRLWLGGELGLAVVTGDRVHPLRIASPDALAGVSGIVTDVHGDVWLSSVLGVVRLPAAEISAAIDDPAHAIAAERFDFHDGLDGTPAQLRPVPTAVAADDGMLWFTTTSGIFTIDPRHVRRNLVPPLVQIVSLTAAGRTWPAGATLPVGTREVDFAYTASTLAQPERARFRVQLEGVDGEWQDAGARRSSHYTNLAPGRYVFRVLAANEDGVWSALPAVSGFDVPPSFEQTWWFRLMWVPVGALLALGLVRWRVRALATRFADRHQAALIERERIARELHDTLLQSVQGLILRFQSGVDRLAAEDPVRATLERSLDRAEEVLIEGRERLGELRAPGRSRATLGESTLGEALRRQGEELAAEHGATLIATLRGETEPLPDRVRDEAFKIGTEGLLNALRHSGAKQVWLTLHQTPSRLELEVSDDGRGMAPTREYTAARTGHWGLVGMRERARAIGGALTLASSEGEGTQVRLVVRLRGGVRRWLWPGGWRRRSARKE